MHLRDLPVERRREIFLALVEVQDLGTPVVTSRDVIAKQFTMTAKQVKAIEEEGLDKEWPPLSDEADSPTFVFPTAEVAPPTLMATSATGVQDAASEYAAVQLIDQRKTA